LLILKNGGYMQNLSLTSYVQECYFPISVTKMTLKNNLKKNTIMAHSHDFSEIVLLADGTLTHHCENESLPLKKGDFFLVHQKMKHGYSDINEKTLCYNILYNSKVAVPMVLLSKSPFLHRLYPDSKENGLFSGILGTVTNRDLPRIVSLLRHMQSETKELRPGHQTLVISLFSTVVLLLSRHCREKITPPQRWSLDKMIGMMNDHLSDNSISMKKLVASQSWDLGERAFFHQVG